MFTCIITAPVALYRQATGIPAVFRCRLPRVLRSPSPEQIARFPQLTNGYTVPWLSPNIQAATYMGLLQEQSAVPVVRSNGNLHYATSVQDAGVPDDLYAYTGRLGAIFRHLDTASEFEEFTPEPDGDIRIKVGLPLRRR